MVRRLLIIALALTTLAIPFATTAAAATDTWISGVGDDANAADPTNPTDPQEAYNCGRVAPCKTFAGALATTDPGGTIHVLDPGGFGAVTITKAITIDGGGFQASALSSGTNGIVIAAGVNDDVTLRNIVVSGAGTTTSGCTNTSGVRGIVVSSARSVHLDHVRIQQYVQGGLRVSNSAGAVSIDADALDVRNICGPAIDVAPSGTGTASVLIRDTTISHATTGVAAASAATVRLLNTTVFGNTRGVSATGTGTIYADALTQIVGNTTDGTPTTVGPPEAGLTGIAGTSGANASAPAKLIVRARAVHLRSRTGRVVRVAFLSTNASSAELTITRGGLPIVRLRLRATAGQNAFTWNGRRAGAGSYGFHLTAVDSYGQADAMTGTLELSR
ncbi:MAG: hypothetical protein ACR2J9_01820 [Gaiellales bacterium]